MGLFEPQAHIVYHRVLWGVYTIQQTSSKCIQNTRANAGCLPDRVNTLLHPVSLSPLMLMVYFCWWLVADSIEANIEAASVNVVHGSEHIRQARSHLVYSLCALSSTFCLIPIISVAECTFNVISIALPRHLVESVDNTIFQNVLQFQYRYFCSIATPILLPLSTILIFTDIDKVSKLIFIISLFWLYCAFLLKMSTFNWKLK